MSSTNEEAPAVRVLGLWASPFVMRVLIALRLKGIEHEVQQEESLSKSEAMGKKSELLLRSNPIYKKVPVFFHHGKPICESLIIVQYIDEVWSSNGPAIFSTDPYTRALERFWAKYIDDKIIPVLLVLSGMGDGNKDEALDHMSDILQLLEETFVKLSNGKHYFGGDNLGYVDIALGSLLGWVRAMEKVTGVRFLDVAKVPHLAAWADRLCVHSAVVDVMPDTDKIVKYSVEFGQTVKAMHAASRMK